MPWSLIRKHPYLYHELSFAMHLLLPRLNSLTLVPLSYLNAEKEEKGLP